MLNREHATRYVLKPQDWAWIPGAREALKSLTHAGIRLSVATNQAAIGRGLMSRAQLDAIHARMQTEAAETGATLDAVFVCPHPAERGCRCRKPEPGLILEAMERARVPADETLVVGDDLRDVEAAWGAGVVGALLRTGKNHAAMFASSETGIPVFDGLPQLADSIVKNAVPSPDLTLVATRAAFRDHSRLVDACAVSLLPTLSRIAATLHQALSCGGKVLTCGNGGSAADSQHFVAELVGRFRTERTALPAIALTADAATLTAVANDFGFEQLFSRQLQALARPGDVLVAISTSGNSANVVGAAATARRLGVTVIALTGAGGGRLAEFADILCAVPSSSVARIQEMHGLCVHSIVEVLDDTLCPRHTGPRR